MASSNGEQSSELLQAQAHVWNHIFNFINSMSLKCAIQLGIPDIIHRHEKPMTLDELVDALPNINKGKSHGVYRLMRILTHSGFFVEEKKGYWLTPACRLLLKDGPYSTTPYVQAMLDPILTKPWEHVSEWLQNERQTAFEIAHGMTFWEYAGHYPMLNHLFNDSMANDSRLVSSILVKDCKHVFEGLNSMVDVAGGTGNVARAIAEAFPS
ncbi:O-methyltransferase family protein [Forsythia ovata]|uniref:O-methyltransferase family protein n=1 Tax=Forsythia ovata TaxID=205694 RepID=A0ABD1R4K9_9LAMI